MTVDAPASAIWEALGEVIDPELGLSIIEIELVREPLWHPDMMTDGARRKLGWEI